MLLRVFDNLKIIATHNFYPGDSSTPKAVLASHFDSHTETSVSHCTNGVSGLPGLGDLSRNPACLLVHFIDECSENTAVMYKYFQEGPFPGVAELYENKLPVTCFDVSQCQNCQKNHARVAGTNADGENVMQHLVDFIQLYICDGKIYFQMLPLKHGSMGNAESAKLHLLTVIMTYKKP